MLILRDATNPVRIHLTHYAGSVDEQKVLADRILAVTSRSYPSGISGGPGR